MNSHRSLGLRRSPSNVPLLVERLEGREPLAADLVLEGSSAALGAIGTDTTSPPQASRNVAIVHAAIDGAVAVNRGPTARIVDQQLVVFGSSANDRLAVDQLGQQLIVRSGTRKMLTISLDGVKSIVIDAAGGADVVHLGEDVRIAATVFGGAGNDSLVGGRAADAIYGEAGDDYILGFSGNDLLDGGDGNDTLIGGPGNDTLLGRRGRNRLSQ